MTEEAYKRYVEFLHMKITQCRQFPGYGTPDAPFVSGQCSGFLMALAHLGEEEPEFPSDEHA